MPEEAAPAPSPTPTEALIQSVLEGVGLDKIQIESNLTFYKATGKIADFTIKEVVGPRLDVVVTLLDGKHLGYYVMQDGRLQKM